MINKLRYGSRRRACQDGLARVVAIPSCLATAPLPPRRHRLAPVLLCMAKPWRPTIDDVDSISRGGPAKVRGTGSRRIPHRLNAEERTLYDLAKKKNFLTVRGTAYRRERHGNPLPNVYRQWCDARGQVCVVVEQDVGGSRGTDRAVVDIAPLRREHTEQVEQALCALAVELGLRQVGFQERPADALPFNILPPVEDITQEEAEEDAQVGAQEAPGQHPMRTTDGSGNSGAAAPAVASGSATSGGFDESSALSPERRLGGSDDSGMTTTSTSGGSSLSVVAAGSEAVLAMQRLVAEQAEVVRQLKSQGRTNSDPDVQEQVRVLLQLKADLVKAEAEAVIASSSAAPRVSLHEEQQAQEAAPSSSRSAVARRDYKSPPPVHQAPRSPVGHYYLLPIWQVPALPLFFEGSRTDLKQFASMAVRRVAEGSGGQRGKEAVTSAASGATQEVAVTVAL